MAERAAAAENSEVMAAKADDMIAGLEFGQADQFADQRFADEGVLAAPLDVSVGSPGVGRFLALSQNLMILYLEKGKRLLRSLTMRNSIPYRTQPLARPDPAKGAFETFCVQSETTTDFSDFGP
jgi:hypothetical protein